MRDWYAAPATKPDEPEEPVRVEWTFILDQWADIECDLHEKFGIDVESGVLEQRSWRWLRTRIHDLITQPSRLHRAVIHHYTTEDKHVA